MEFNAGYLPLISTIIALMFAVEIFRYYLKYKTAFLLWWTFALCMFGSGTLLEFLNAVFGWNPVNFRLWYIVGALLGGFPLAQGTVTILMPPRFIKYSTIIAAIYLSVAIVCVLMSPLQFPEDFKGRFSGELFAWQWVRWLSPLLNLYTVIFAFGGAVYAANQYFVQINKESKFISCIYASFGTILASIGGVYTRIGYMNALFITELVSILLIYRGFKIFTRSREDEELI